MKISVVTPVRDCPELIADYTQVVAGCEVVIVDNDSAPAHGDHWRAVALTSGGVYIHNAANEPYAAACNQGYANATGDVIVFLNNDVTGPAGCLLAAVNQIHDGALYGPELATFAVPGQPIAYVAGWCIAATRATWSALDAHYGYPWNSDMFRGNYAEDLDLSWRAARLGLALRKWHLPITHLSNYTAQRTPGAYDHADANRKRFVERVLEVRNA